MVNRNRSLITSGTLSGAASRTITSIPDRFSHLILLVVGGSSGSTEQPEVQVSVDNGSTYDTTAGSYVGKNITGTTWAANTLASLIESATHLAAQTHTYTLYLYGYQGLTNPWCYARVQTNVTEYQVFTTYIGSTSAINAIKMLGSAGGTYDAGSYKLFGVR